MPIVVPKIKPKVPQGKKAKQLREARKLRQEDVAAMIHERCGSRRENRATIAALETRDWIGSEWVAAYSAIFGVSPSIFFDVPEPLVESREQMIERALDYIASDPTVPPIRHQAKEWPDDAKLMAIRLYERWKGRKLIDEGTV